MNPTSKPEIVNPTTATRSLGRVGAGGVDVRGIVFLDLDGDGQKSAGDAPAAGAIVTFTPADGSGPPVRLSAGSDGSYVMANLTPMRYIVTLTPGSAGVGVWEAQTFEIALTGSETLNLKVKVLGAQLSRPPIAPRALALTGAQLLGLWLICGLGLVITGTWTRRSVRHRPRHRLVR